MKTSLKSAGRVAGMCLGAVLAGGLCFAQPAVTLSVRPDRRPAVSPFPASAAVDIYFDTADLALAVTNSAGSFSGIRILEPAAALPGTNWISGVARISGDAAQAPFKVGSNWAQFHFASSHTGLNPYENVLSPSTAGNLGQRWSYAAGSDVASSPAVVNEVVYVGSGDNDVYALNAATGAKLWQFDTRGPVDSSPQWPMGWFTWDRATATFMP
jgi:hypothetical protein